MSRPLAIFALAVGAACTLSAQTREMAPYRHRGAAQPDAERRAAKAALPSLHALRALPAAYRLAPLTAADLAAKPTSLAVRAGVHREVGIAAAQQSGRWEMLPTSSGAVWRMSINSPGAAGVRIHFRDFRLPAGARLWLHDGSGKEAEIMGPYEGRGVHGDGDFWSDFVLAETIVIEYQPAAGASAGGLGDEALPFRIAGISHLLPGVLPDPPRDDFARAFGPPLSIAPRPSAVTSIVESLLSPLASASPSGDPRFAAASCNLDISCYPEWAQTARSVAHIVFEDGNSSFVCSGTLLATSDSNGIPYFLTADHCISSDTVARTVQAFWQYQTTRCDGPAANRRDALRTLGARYVKSEGVARGDYSLVRLTATPNDVVFSGWSTGAINLGTELVGIHHPAGDYKRFSRGIRINTGSQLRGADPAFYYTVSMREGLIEGGSSGSGLFSAPGVLAGVLSSGPKTETPCNIVPFPANYGRFAEIYPAMADFLEGRRTDIPGAAQPPASGGTQQSLSSGEPRSFSVGPVSTPTLLNSSAGFFIDVPEGSTRLSVKIAVVEEGEHALGVWARYEAVPTVQNGSVLADHNAPGASGFEEIVIDAASTPALRSGRYYIALGLFSTGVTVNGAITATVSGAAGSNPSGTGTALTPGTAAQVAIPAVTSARLFSGAAGYYVTVPEGTQRLELRLRTDQDVDLDLFASAGAPPVVQGGRVQATYSATGSTGNETLVITGTAAQPLSGTYYAGIAVFTTGVDIAATLTAITSGGGSASGPVVLRSGASQSFSLPAAVNPQLVPQQYAIDVPAGARGLEVRLATSTPGVDLDLYARFETPAAVASGRVQADHSSEGATGTEVILITPESSPALREGRYYLAMAVFTTGKAIDGTLVATVVTAAPTPPPAQGSRVLTPQSPAKFSLPAVDMPTLFAGDYSYAVTVPEGTRSMQLRLSADTPSVDTDLYVRFGSDVDLDEEGNIVADHSGESNSGNELLTIGPSSQPSLRAGTYYVALGLLTRNTPATGTISVTFERDFTPPPAPVPAGPGRLLEPGQPAEFTLPASSGATLFRGDLGFRFNAPSADGKLTVVMRAADPSVDVDLYLRYGAEPSVENGRPVADHLAQGGTGDETIVVSSPALRAGTYYAAFGLYTPRREARGTITATFTPANQPAGGLIKVFELSASEQAEPDLALPAKAPGSASVAMAAKTKGGLVKALP